MTGGSIYPRMEWLGSHSRGKSSDPATLVELGRRPQREVFVAIKTLVLKFSPEQVSSHSNQQQYYCNPRALKYWYYFFPCHNGWLYTHTQNNYCKQDMAAYHQLQNEFKKSCRVRGERISRNGVSFSCQQHTDNIAHWLLESYAEMIVLISILLSFAMGALVSHYDQRRQQRRVNNTTTVSRLSLGPVTPQMNALYFEKVSTGGQPKKICQNPGRPATISTTGSHSLLTTSPHLHHSLSFLSVKHLQGK